MRTVILVPRRRDNGWRDAVWAICRQRWEALFPDWPIFEGHHTEGLFNRSAAINEAARLAGDWKIALVIDADVMLPQPNVLAAVEKARKTGKVVWAHRRWRGFSEEATELLMRPKANAAGMLGPGGFLAPTFTADIDLLVEKTTSLSWSCCIAFTRKAWDTIGGFDARFRGWGFEDLAAQALACGLVGHDRIEGDVLHFWHPRSPGLGTATKHGRVYSPEAIVNARLGRRYMVALRRDYGITDRPGRSTAEAIERDIANLKRDDALLAIAAQRHGLPDWSDWWPTLEELRDGWTEEDRLQRERANTVTIIVHTGGDPGTWSERSGYLRRSLASLQQQVSGRVVQRVIYSDWGAEYQADLEAIAAEFGFYVVGPAQHQGYTGSMQMMWKYLSKRGQGEFVFQTEDDFTFSRAVDLDVLIDALAARPTVAQVVLLRGAYYPREVEQGGILGWPATSFEKVGMNGTSMLLHRLFWSQNPTLFRRALTATPWPSGPSSERLFGDMLLRDPEVRFALWGEGEPWIEHIGETRAGSAY